MSTDHYGLIRNFINPYTLPQETSCAEICLNALTDLAQGLRKTIEGVKQNNSSEQDSNKQSNGFELTF